MAQRLERLASDRMSPPRPFQQRQGLSALCGDASPRVGWARSPGGGSQGPRLRCCWMNRFAGVDPLAVARSGSVDQQKPDRTIGWDWRITITTCATNPWTIPIGAYILTEGAAFLPPVAPTKWRDNPLVAATPS